MCYKYVYLKIWVLETLSRPCSCLLCKTYWTMCPVGRNHSWLCNWWAHMALEAVLSAGCFPGCVWAATASPQYSPSRMVKDLRICNYALLKSWGKYMHLEGCIYVDVCLHVQAIFVCPCAYWADRGWGTEVAPPSEKFCTRHGSILSLPAILRSLFLVGLRYRIISLERYSAVCGNR